jgi:tetratricopeptide (TPR) repeat protein
MREENEFFYSEDETMEIVQKYEDMLKHNQNVFFDVIDFENIIDYYLNTDDSQRASQAVNIAYNIHPHSSEIQLKKAELLLIDKNFTDALKILRVLSKIDPDNSEVFFLKGQAYIAAGDIQHAQEAFLQSTKCFAVDKLDLLYRIASLYQDIDEPNYALRYLLLGYNIDRNSLNMLFELAYCYERLGDLDRSENFYNQYLDINPFSSSVWYNLGIVFTRKADFNRALEAYDYALVVEPTNASAMHNMANTYATIENYADAAYWFVELLQFEPNNARILASIGECYEKLGEYDKAMHFFNRSFEIEPLLPDAYFGIGIVNLKQQNIPLALENIRKAISLEPENYDFWLGLAKVLFEMGADVEALNAYQEAANLNPEEIDAYIGIAELKLFQELFSEVEEIYHEVSDRFSDNPALKVIYAAALYLQGKPNVAISILRQAKKLNSLAVDEFLAVVSVINDPKFLEKLNSI